jgi:hypothetical protein
VRTGELTVVAHWADRPAELAPGSEQAHAWIGAVDDVADATDIRHDDPQGRGVLTLQVLRRTVAQVAEGVPVQRALSAALGLGEPAREQPTGKQTRPRERRARRHKASSSRRSPERPRPKRAAA